MTLIFFCFIAYARNFKCCFMVQSVGNFIFYHRWETLQLKRQSRVICKRSLINSTKSGRRLVSKLAHQKHTCISINWSLISSPNLVRACNPKKISEKNSSLLAPTNNIEHFTSVSYIHTATSHVNRILRLCCIKIMSY